MSAHHLSPKQTGDTQLSLFGDHEAPPPAAKAIRRGQPGGDHPAHYLMESTQPHSEPPKYDPHQLALLINPTEHIQRMRESGDFWNERYDPTNHPNPAPTKQMAGLWQRKENESRSTYDHGAGLYDIIASGEQIREPIEVFAYDNPERDQQYEGHHRVAAGHAVERDTGKRGSVWLPVKYHDYTSNQRRPKWMR